MPNGVKMNGVSSPHLHTKDRAMLELNIKLWRNYATQDWSLEVGGTLHANLSDDTVCDIVEYFLLTAQQTLVAP